MFTLLETVGVVRRAGIPSRCAGGPTNPCCGELLIAPLPEGEMPKTLGFVAIYYNRGPTGMEKCHQSQSLDATPTQHNRCSSDVASVRCGSIMSASAKSMMKPILWILNNGLMIVILMAISVWHAV
jgi:hypothetical protein